MPTEESTLALATLQIAFRLALRKVP